MNTRYRAYLRLTSKARWLWKLWRFLLWGRINFNNTTAWEREYDSVGDDEVACWSNRIPNLVARALEISEPYGSILEISAGYGNFLLKVNPEKQRLATEFSTKALEYLASHNISTKRATLPNVPYGDSSVDIVVAISVFEHLDSKTTVRNSFAACHRVCREGMLFSVPYQCMQPWSYLIHNFDFSKADIVRLTDGLFEMDCWEVIRDNVTNRSISFLRKV